VDPMGTGETRQLLSIRFLRKIGRQHVKMLMLRMGWRCCSPSAQHQAGARPQNLSVSESHRDRAAEPGVAMDITYIQARLSILTCARMAQPSLLSWRLSIPMEAAFCVATLAWGVTASRATSTRTRAASSRGGLHRRACRQRHRDQHGQS
jgi:hypothetical protein